MTDTHEHEHELNPCGNPPRISVGPAAMLPTREDIFVGQCWTCGKAFGAMAEDEAINAVIGHATNHTASAS